MSGPIAIRPTDDFERVRELGIAAGLESGDRHDEQVVVAWGAYDDGDLIGGITLSRYQGRLDVVNWMSIAESHRGRGIAARLLATLEDEARRRGISALWVTARAPGFFLSQGYERVGEGVERDILLGTCPECEQYGVTCDPQAMRKVLGES